MAQRVWILGAGFSQPLGGPLLDDLFSERMESELQAHYGIALNAEQPAQWMAVNLFRWGTGNPFKRTGSTEKPQPGERLWQHAEDYLDRLDVACLSEGPSSTLIEAAVKKVAGGDSRLLRWIINHNGSIVREIATEAKQWMAAECCVFLENAELMSERWTPYRSWINSLTHEDAIISFNYDRVLETLIAAGFGNRQVVDPSDVQVDNSQTPIFKLHGSVDWERQQRDSEVVYEITDDPKAAMKCGKDSLGIAPPGPSKKNSIDELKPLWSRAMSYLKEAHEVYFMGYRFPESDTEAVGRLLTVMRSGKAPRAIIVLGPDEKDVRIQRLKGLLKACFISKVEIVPLFTQDFMTTYALLKQF